ncbi:hypothetical protein [Sphingomonas paucimobilis]|uniref:hypothetical protein n=1 Tax=Sphingomonas paucimobilis TaxID=13689 RepID=UPI00242C1F12|nr:hypothetical protein [Sphingomonas paucimobilis]
MSAAPTSGPWQVKHDFDLDGLTTVIGNVDGEIIDGTTHASFDFVCRTIDEADDSQSPAVAIANARLCVAAPDLLEACKLARKQLAIAVIANSGGLITEDDVGEHRGVAALDRAIAKATGQ